MGSAARAILAGGLLAGLPAVCAEAAWIAATRTPQSGWTMLAGAIYLYPLVSAAFSIGFLPLTLVPSLRRKVGRAANWTAFSFGATLAAITGVVLRHRYGRDVLHEQPLGGFEEAASAVTALVLAVAGFVAARWLLAPKRLPGLIRLRWALLVWFLAIPVLQLLAPPFSSPTPPKAPPGNPERTPERANRPDIIYLMVDTLRADFVGAYGSVDTRTPAMDSLARDGILFEQMISAAPWTRPSVASQLTSWPPMRHGARHKASHIDSGAVSLAQVLTNGGYETLGFFNNGHVSASWGFARGFQGYETARRESHLGPFAGMHLSMVGRQVVRLIERSGLWTADGPTYLPAAELFTRARRILEARQEDSAPLFLFLHVYDPHDPYFEHPGDDRFTRAANEDPPPSERNQMRRLYAGEVEYLDEHLGHFLEWLRKTGRYDDTVIVLVADHGEEFQEHDHSWHGLSLYEEQIHVPFLLKPAGREPPAARHAALVSSLDIAPTLVSLVGLNPAEQWEGRVLVRDDELIDPMRSYVLSETDLENTALRAVRGKEEKLILSFGNHWHGYPEVEYFDLAEDPGEQNDRTAERPDRTAQLRKWLQAERGMSLAD